jgi:NAD(P)-dependent dehydrogenase (short-subunit alcohol dehydrogenase family)
VQRILDAALARFGHVDAWVNNAGRGITRPVSALSDADFDEMMLVNAKSALYGMQAVLPHFQARGRGHIVNVSSMLGRVPFVPTRSAYSASKHALNALTANLRMELRGRWPGIHVSIAFWKASQADAVPAKRSCTGTAVSGRRALRITSAKPAHSSLDARSIRMTPT